MQKKFKKQLKELSKAEDIETDALGTPSHKTLQKTLSKKGTTILP